MVPRLRNIHKVPVFNRKGITFVSRYFWIREEVPFRNFVINLYMVVLVCLYVFNVNYPRVIRQTRCTQDTGLLQRNLLSRERMSRDVTMLNAHSVRVLANPLLP